MVVLSAVFDLFAKQSPVTVMVRATMENVLSADQKDNNLIDVARPPAVKRHTFQLHEMGHMSR